MGDRLSQMQAMDGAAKCLEALRLQQKICNCRPLEFNTRLLELATAVGAKVKSDQFSFLIFGLVVDSNRSDAFESDLPEFRGRGTAAAPRTRRSASGRGIRASVRRL